MQFKCDIGIFRIAVIFFLVVFHAFCPYGGHWNSIDADILAYWWLDNWSYSFFLQGFVFISGFLFGAQLLRKKSEGGISIKRELKKKFQRLMVPSLVFSTIYMMLFNQWQGWLTPYRIINGWQHFWFLPMLFSCFVVCLIVNRLRIKPLFVILVSGLLMLIPLPGLPMRIDMVCKYFVFFYVGVLGGGGIYTISVPRWSIPILLVLQIASFVLLFSLKCNNDILMKKYCFLPPLFEFIYSSLGVFVLFNLSRLISEEITDEKYLRIIETANSYCFGVYIYQHIAVH